jgi:hypothetical protein
VRGNVKLSPGHPLSKLMQFGNYLPQSLAPTLQPIAPLSGKAAVALSRVVRHAGVMIEHERNDEPKLIAGARQ